MPSCSTFLSSILISYLAAGCGVEPDLGASPEVEDGLVIASADEHRITGTYGENGRGLEFVLELDGDYRFAAVGARGETWISSVFFPASATTTVLERLTFVRTHSGLESIGDVTAYDDLVRRDESALLSPLQTALRTHGIVDEIVALP